VPFSPSYLPVQASPQQSIPSIKIQILHPESQLHPLSNFPQRVPFAPAARTPQTLYNYLCSFPTPTAASRKASNFAPKDAAKATLDFRATISREDCCLRVRLLDWTTSSLLPPGQLFDFPGFVGRVYRGSFRGMLARAMERRWGRFLIVGLGWRWGRVCRGCYWFEMGFDGGCSSGCDCLMDWYECLLARSGIALCFIDD
jgi:hypothetical protein